MASPTIPMYLPKSAQEGIVQFSKSCYDMMGTTWNFREQLRRTDLSYIREEDWTLEHRKAKIANRYGDADKLQNITVPVVMPQVEAAVAYQSSVFLSGLPIFESVAHPAFEDEALQFNTILEDQSVKGGWTRELQMFLRDGFKHNICALEVNWDSIVTAAVETDLNYNTKEAKPISVQWEGNTIKRLDMYNTIFDHRCAPTEISSKGEFVGYTELKSRVALKDFINKLPVKMVDNITAAFESGIAGNGSGVPTSYYIPQINPDVVLNKNNRSTTDWISWAALTGAQKTIDYRNMYELTTLYGRIIPSDFNLRVPSPNTPQIWKFILVNNSTIIYAERQTNAHNLIPILFGQPYEDGLAYQTKSLAANALPFQQVSSTLLNQSIAASRKAIFDRMIYDPSRIREADINNPNPASKIPVKPAAYGKSVGDAYQAVPFRDDQSANVFQKLGQLAGFTDEATGRNRSQRGLFTKGNRTKEEYVDTMSNANGRDQLTSMLLEAQVFTPLKEILKINILQYQGGTKLYSATEQQPVTIDPVALRNAVLSFKMADGLTPTAKQIDSDTLQVAMQTMGATPAIAAGYNIGPMFSYLMKTQGAELKPFEKSAAQVAYEQAVGQWQQMVQNAVETVTKAGKDVAALMKSLPPQPTPEQFNYTPGILPQDSATTGKPAPTIMQQVITSTQQPQPGGTPNGAATS